jgi:hypothetical protein
MSRLFPFIVVLLAIGLFFGYVRPAWEGEVAETRAEIASYNNALEAAARFQQKQAALEQERNKLPPEQLERLNTFLPDSVDNIQLIVDLNALASRSGVTLSNFVTSSVPNESNLGGNSSSNGTLTSNVPPVDSLTLTMSAAGTYSSFRTFLSGIEQSLRPLDLVGLVVTNSETGVYTYQITLKFYWLH